MFFSMLVCSLACLQWTIFMASACLITKTAAWSCSEWLFLVQRITHTITGLERLGEIFPNRQERTAVPGDAVPLGHCPDVVWAAVLCPFYILKMSYHSLYVPFTFLPFSLQLSLFKSQWNWPFFASYPLLSAVSCSLLIPLKLKLDLCSSWEVCHSPCNRNHCRNCPKPTIIRNSSLLESVKACCI